MSRPDPETLETLRLEDFNGQLPSLTFTAHPKLDGNELLGFGYEAKVHQLPRWKMMKVRGILLNAVTYHVEIQELDFSGSMWNQVD